MQQEEIIKSIPSDRLQFFPIMMFAIVMGLAGLTLVYKKVSEALYLPSIVYMIMMVFTTIIFFIVGAVFHIFFTFYTIKFWINNNLEMQHSNPAWFIPIVGNLIVPIAGKGFIDDAVLYFYFSIGIFFWIILFSIILNRIIFHNQFAPKFMPTLFILIAPPAIGFISYVKLTGNLDFFAQILFNLGLFFTILVFVMYKNFINIKFFISWWAFTFPMAAITLATVLMYELTHKGFYAILSYILMVITSVIIVLVARQTIIHMNKKEICIME